MPLSEHIKADIPRDNNGEITRLRTVLVCYLLNIVRQPDKRLLNGVLRVLLVFQDIVRYPEHKPLVVFVQLVKLHRFITPRIL